MNATDDRQEDPENAAESLGAPFEVELRRSGILLFVPSHRTLLDVICDVAPDTPYGCREGYCGACQTSVIEGRPEHHDDFLSAEEQASNNTMMICVGRSLTAKLVLDL